MSAERHWTITVFVALVVCHGCSHTPLILAPAKMRGCSNGRLGFEDLRSGEQLAIVIRCGPAVDDGHRPWQENYRQAGFAISPSETFKSMYLNGLFGIFKLTPPESTDLTLDTPCGEVFGFAFTKGDIHGEIVGESMGGPHCSAGREYRLRVQRSRIPEHPEPWHVSISIVDDGSVAR